TVVFNGPDTLRRGGDVTGKVAEVAEGKSITLELLSRERRGEEAKKVTIPVDSKTVVSFSNVAKGDAKIATGQNAMVWYADDGKTAAKVHLHGSAAEAGGRDDKRPEVMGKVMRTADDGSKFVVEVPPANRGDEPTRVTITLAEKGSVIFNNVPADGAKASPDM